MSVYYGSTYRSLPDPDTLVGAKVCARTWAPYSRARNKTGLEKKSAWAKKARVVRSSWVRAPFTPNSANLGSRSRADRPYISASLANRAVKGKHFT